MKRLLILSACMFWAGFPPISTAQQAGAETPLVCRATIANGERYDAEPAGGNHGNGYFITSLWSQGAVVFKPGGPGFVGEDGSLAMKWPWWRLVRGPLAIEGRRLDGAAPPLRAHIPDGYHNAGFQSSALVFPTPGCWEVTGSIGEASLTFVTEVVKIGEGPVRKPAP
jgi:hypothetical protein